jgi:trehalose/maltose hydrolase-like predicted phosphorylase
MLQALEPTRDPGWVLTHDGYDVLTENAVESRFALGNGFLGMRASRPVSRGPTKGTCLDECNSRPGLLR